MTPFAGAKVGAVLSADIAVPEHERELRFYARVLSTGDRPLWREDDLMNNLGMPIIGLGARGAEYAHLPLQWMPHVQVADVAASVERAGALGGAVVMHATDDDGQSRWAVVLDPDGAAFGLISVHMVATALNAAAPAAPETDEPVGRIAWLDLTVSDAARTRDFYREVIQWQVENVEMKDDGERYADYNMLDGSGSPAAGICHARGVNAGLPPVWMIYLPVGDLEESVRRVQEEGGSLVRAARYPDGRYLHVVISDPLGACLALVQG